MNTHPTRALLRPLLALGVAALLTVTTAGAQVASGTTGIDASGRYDKEVQSCLSGKTQQDQATCLREARNALASKKGELPQSNGTDYTANAASRCNALSGEDKAACQARVMGYGSESGSVAGGGVLSKVETVVMPASASSVLIEPKTATPVVLIPSTPQ